ncbi:MAG: tyrosinase family protein, partial [Roseobacter sp.]|nr:tyrosinase family protein [Roseobacter sp.]
MSGIRRNIATLGGPWSETMLWYARAVGAMQTREFNDRTSWRYFAAIHGINGQGWIAENIISNTTPVPPQNEFRLLFNQCQHAGWFFLPWHRGYLAAFESVLASWIEAEGGPSDWALPYWNYLDAGNANARDLPVEFRDTTVPGDNVPNPLAQASRGPQTVLGPAPWTNNTDITLAAQTNNSVYTAVPGTLGYGGPISGFNQQGNAFGAVEGDPHNFVHVMLGGNFPGAPTGWMFDPDFAALDPVFWLHHCNIDRLWAAWMTQPANAQDTSSQWRNGPFPRQFAMPDPTGAISFFIPDDTLPGQSLAPDYDDLSAGTGIPATGGGAIMAASSTSGSGRSSLGS